MKTNEKLNLSDIYNKNYGYIYNYVLCTLKTNEIAEEVTNDVFIKFNNYINSFDAEKSSITTYLHTIAKSCIIDFFRKENKHSICNSIDSFVNDNGDSFIQIKSVQVDAVNQISYKETTAKVQNIISKMKNVDHRKVSELFFFDDMSYQQIADICQISLVNVKVILNRCRQTLQTELKAIR